MCIRNFTAFGSTLASVTYLKRIQTPHSLCLYNLLVGRLSATEFKFESKFKPLPVIRQSLRRLFQRVVEGLEGKNQRPSSRGSSLAEFCTAWAGWTGKHKYRVFHSRLQSLQAATSSLEEIVLPLMRYWLSLTLPESQKVFNALWISGRYEHFLFYLWKSQWNEIFDGIGEKMLPAKAVPIASFNLSICLSIIGFWVKLWHRNKTVCS